ncbi:MAG: hypothetical protein ACR2MG_20535 [Pyrinomonadaceae bacterium]
MKSDYFQLLVQQAKTDEAGALQRTQLFSLLKYVTKQIVELEVWLHKKEKLDDQVQLLMTQKGVGYLTALCLVNPIGEMRPL